MIIYTAKNRYDKILTRNDWSWQELTDKVRNTVRTQESLEQYKSFDRKKQSDIKDVGGFVGGDLKDGQKKLECVLSRSVISLDLDRADESIYEILNLYLADKNAVVYSTHKHTKTAPRLRIIIELKEPLLPDEYIAVGRMIASEIGIDFFDDTTYEPGRLMFFPSTSIDEDYYFKEYLGLPVDGKKILNEKYKNWRDTSEWPLSAEQKKKGNVPFFKTGKGDVKDPREKPGIIGTFCRAYTIEAVIEKFIPDVYEPCGQDRYTYTQADTAAGLVVFDHIFCYSHHATDPINGKMVNAFDLMRIHKFGNLDSLVPNGTKVQDLPSYKAALTFAKNDSKVKELLIEDLPEEDRSWAKDLLRDKKGDIADNMQNYILILEHDKALLPIAFNGLLEGIVVTGRLPWPREAAPSERFSDYDYASLREYMNSKYNVSNKSYIEDALFAVAGRRYFHPIRDYFNGLKWDGQFRLDNLLINYLGAEDTEYVKAITRKTFTAAAARIYEPGVKFDTMLVLNGKQGLGKSTLFAKMAGDDWFSDSLSMQDMKSKDAPEKLLGKLILEVPELAGMSKAEETDVKAFLSRRVDSYRAAFGKSVQDHKRQCIIVGTTNSQDGFLKDTSGNRRFWPVKVNSGKAKFSVWSLTQDIIDQLWAEAVYWYKQGEMLYLNKDLEGVAAKKQKEQIAVDEKLGLIEAYLEIPIPDNWDRKSIAERQAYCYMKEKTAGGPGKNRRMKVSNIEIWCECYGMPKERITRRDSNEIVRLMSTIDGWDRQDAKSYVSDEYGQQRIYIRAEDDRL